MDCFVFRSKLSRLSQPGEATHSASSSRFLVGRGCDKVGRLAGVRHVYPLCMTHVRCIGHLYRINERRKKRKKERKI